MITNPCVWFCGGGNYADQKSFTYKNVDPIDVTNGATKEELEEQILKEAKCPNYLWHFSPKLNGLTDTMECNIVWFANTVTDAIRVLKEMFEFRIECAKVQNKYYTGKTPTHWESFSGREKSAMKFYYAALKLIEEQNIVITLAPVNQFYEVGWADNDTLP